MGSDVFKKQQLRLSHLISIVIFGFVFLFVPFGDLSILLLDFVNFRNVNKCDMFLSVDLLKFETLVYGVATTHVDPFFDQGKFNLLFLAVLSHYYFIT